MDVVRLSAYAQIVSGILSFTGILPGELINLAYTVLLLSIPVYLFTLLFWLKTVDKNSQYSFAMIRFGTVFVAWIPLLGPIITYPFVYLKYQSYAP